VRAVVCHSGGIDSTVTLQLAVRAYGPEAVISLGFDYGQRHREELTAAARIAAMWGVQRRVLPIAAFQCLDDCGLVNSQTALTDKTLVIGRNGLMAWHAAILAASVGANEVFLGVLESEGKTAGYRDCSRAYMDLLQELLRHDLANPDFAIVTPLVHATKQGVLRRACELGILDLVLTHTVSCYEGRDCGECLSCQQRYAAIKDLCHEYR
jgi:7-cyano-7-deazaguanine synthase